MNNPINLPDDKKIYLVMISTWIFYVIQIIFILSFSLSNMDYYKNTIVLNDLALFLISCGTCIFLTFGIARNNRCYYICSIISTVIFDLLVVITMTFLIGNSYNEYGHRGIKIGFIVIKSFELLPGFLILINPKLIKGSNNNNINNNNLANNNVNPNNNMLIIIFIIMVILIIII